MKYLLLLFWFPVVLSAQADSVLVYYDEDAEPEVLWQEEAESSFEAEKVPYVPPPIQPIKARPIAEKNWKDATKGLDYSNDVPKKKKEEVQKEPKKESSPAMNWGALAQSLGFLFQILAILLALGLISYGIYWMMQAPKNKALARDGTEITLANLDHYVLETDLNRFLREAKAAANWSLAIRLYFLLIIKQLSDNGSIRWAKEKTNRDFLRETNAHPLGPDIRSITRQYERIWYGNQGLDAQTFVALEADFQALLSSLQKAALPKS